MPDIFTIIVVVALLAAGYIWLKPRIDGVVSQIKQESAKETTTSQIVDSIIETVDLEEDPLMCLTSLSNLDYTQRLQCYKALRNHTLKVSGLAAAQKLDKEVLPIIIDDSAEGV